MTRAGAGKRLAGTGVAVTITGVREIDERLRKLEPTLQKKVLTQSMRKAMALVQKQAVLNARKAFTSRTGATVKGIKVRATKRSRKRFGVDVRVNKGAYVDKTFYSAFVEFGTSKMKPRPFMAPAHGQAGAPALMMARRLMLMGLEHQVKMLGRG